MKAAVTFHGMDGAMLWFAANHRHPSVRRAYYLEVRGMSMVLDLDLTSTSMGAVL